MSSILLTIDVEDWFQVENFKECIPYSSWSSCELRVERNTHRLLDLFDSFSSTVNPQLATLATPHETLPSLDAAYSLESHSKFKTHDSQVPSGRQAAKLPGSRAGLRATFFVLGWLAERLPNLVREIYSRGHEVASHGFHHELCNKQSRANLKQDLADSKKLLEDITGAPVYGYRAPSFSINDNILKLIRDCGYLYDSSYNSFAMHVRYGKLNLPGHEATSIAIPIQSVHASEPDSYSSFKIQNSKFKTDVHAPQPPSRPAAKPPSFYELPISNLYVKKPFSYLLSAISSKQNQKDFVLPWGGGGYFRLIPFPLFKRGVELILKKNGAYLFYMHPWEIDPNQPKVNAINRSYKFRHYINLDKTFARLKKILYGFDSCRFITCSEYLNGQEAPSFKIQNS